MTYFERSANLRNLFADPLFDAQLRRSTLLWGHYCIIIYFTCYDSFILKLFPRGTDFSLVKHLEYIRCHQSRVSSLDEEIFFIYYFLLIIQSEQSYINTSFTICRGLSSCILITSSVSKRRTNGMESRAENRTWGLPYNKPLQYQLSHATHLTEPRRTILSHAAPC